MIDLSRLFIHRRDERRSIHTAVADDGFGHSVR